MKRSINGFDIDWVGKDRIDVRRDRAPKHGYEFETSLDHWRINRLISTSPVDSEWSRPGIRRRAI
jgi:hypothetical protein